MPDKIDMSLDDIVKQNKKPGATRGRGGFRRGGARGSGLFRGRGNIRGGGIIKRRSAGGSAKTSPFKAAARVPDGKWLHDMYSGGSAGIRSGPAKIVISNLDFGVNDKDIKDLFEEFGPIRKAAVHYDRSGRSLGTADVIFEKKQDASKAINKYNGVQLDGRAMTIQFATNSPGNAGFGVGGGGGGGGLRGTGRVGPTRGGFSRRGGRGGMRGGRGGGRRINNNNNKPAKTQAELDAELDTYTKMQTD